MDSRTEFAMRALTHLNFSELCAEYGISRKTGYKWKQRFLAQGLHGLDDQSRRPQSHGKELGEGVVIDIIRLKLAHKPWGPLKIRALYRRQYPHRELPSESSFKRVLERAGLTEERKRRRAAAGGRIFQGLEAEVAHDLWSVDFKGWWRNRKRQKIEPLTVRDEASRYLLELYAVPNARTETVQKRFELLFEIHGLPRAIRSDNGTPFASTNGLHGLSRLSAWWIALGIDLERSRPGKPQDNGAHERMHLDVRNELENGHLGHTQESFDLWRYQFNHERPHQALGQTMPVEHFQPSPRRWQGTPDELDYGGARTAKVSNVGAIRWRGERIFISQALTGWNLGLKHTNDDREEVWFAHLLIGHLHRATASFHPTPTPLSTPQNTDSDSQEATTEGTDQQGVEEDFRPDHPDDPQDPEAPCSAR